MRSGQQLPQQQEHHLGAGAGPDSAVEIAPLSTLAAQLDGAAEPVQRLYGPPLAQVGYRNHALQSRVETTYGYNPLELAAYATYASAAESNPALVDGLAASIARCSRLNRTVNE